MSNEAFVEPDFKALFEGGPGLYMVLDSNLRVVAASDAYLQATLTRRADILGRHVFDVFPDNPDDPTADAVRNSRASFNRVLQTHATDVMGLQRHDVRKPESEGGGFEVRYWSAVNSSVLNPDGSIAYILHRVENVTEFVLQKQQGVEQAKLTDALREQAVQMEAEIYSRSREAAETSQKLKQANEELARHREHLEELVRERTARLEAVNAQLQVEIGERKLAEVALQEANEELEVSAEELRLQNEELMRAQSALQEGEARLRRFYESGLIGVIYWSMDGVITGANDKFLEMVGYTRQDLVAGRIDWVNITPPEYRHLDEDSAIELKALGVNKKPFEKEYIRKDGKRIPIIVAGAMLDEARFNGVAFVLDITDRKRAEEELRYHANLVDNVSDAVISTDRELKIRSWNKAAERMYGWQLDEVIGLKGSDVLQTTFPEGLSREAIAKDIFEKGGWEGELIQRTKDGRDITVHARSMVLKDEAGNVIGGVSISHDITERKLAEEALRESEDRYRTLFNSMSEGFAIQEIVYDDKQLPVDLRFIDVNPMYERLVGLKRADVIGRLRNDLFAVADTYWLEKYNNVVLTGEPAHFENYSKAVGRYFEVYVFPIKPPRFGVIFMDITERKRAEEELERLASFPRLNPNPVVEVDLEGRVHFLNPAAKQLFPDLQGMGRDHPWLADWELVARMFCENKASTYVRDVSLGENWYQQAMYFMADAQRIRIYSLDITERKRAEVEIQKLTASVQQEKDKLLTLVNSIPDEVWFADSQKNISLVNPAVLNEFGSSTFDSPEVEAIAGSSEVYRPDGTPRPVEEAPPLRALKGEIIRNQEEIVRTPASGELRYRQVNAAPVKDANGNIIGSVSVVRDITERKCAEEALRESEARRKVAAAVEAEQQRLFGVLETLPTMICLLTPDYHVAFANRSFREKFGESHGRRCYEYCFGYTEPCEFCETYNVLKTGQPHHWEVTGPDGSVIDAYDFPFNDVDGSPMILEMDIDITDRRKSEVELARHRGHLEEMVKERTSELQAVLDAAPVAVWIAYDPQCQQITGNAYADRILQAPPGGNISRSALPGEAAVSYKVFHNGVEMQPEELPAQIAAVTGKPVDGAELELVFPNGRKVHLLASAVPLFDAEGHVRGSITAGADVTALKLAEEELRRARDDLEQRVQKRTEELSSAKEELEVTNEELQVELEQHQKLEAELIRAKDNAEAAAKAKAQFLANMSHEIRTPMNSIIGFTELMLDEDEPLSPEQRDNLETIRINGDALLSLINDILDFSKMESDKVVLEEYQFNLRQCMEESLDLVALRASEKSLNLAYIINKNVPDAIIGDPGRLRQVLGNLLSNAVKFTDKGEVTLSVSAREIDGTNEVHFAVHDTGIGIPQDRMSLLFQSFSQIEPSTTRLYGGTGLGLAISKKLVEMMGGKIWVESEPGKGSTFHFTIKVSSGESESKLDGVRHDLVGKRVLIVSDNKTNRSILGKQVYSRGMIPMIVASGQEALGWVQRGDDFDVAILDMDMQDMNGIGLETAIRKYNRTLPLVLLTSIGQRIPPNHAYLTKPIKTSQLHKVLTEILSRQSDQRPVRAPAARRPSQNNPLRILLAEDNVSSQKVALQMLKMLGYKTDTVANGIEALQALDRQHYDLVLMDVRMPEMDGLEATRIIRQRWPDNGPKIIAVTAYALEGDREKFIEVGMDDYIAKPVKMDQLAKVLSKYQPK